MLVGERLTTRIDGHILLDDVSVAFEPGKLSLILGPNGAGKSTLVKALCGHTRHTSGVVRYGGQPLEAWSDAELAKVRAVLSQNIEVSFPLKAWEVVMMGRYPHFTGKPRPRDEAACQEAMRFFDVWGMADRNYMTLSGGERQRVQFARVLAQIWYPPSEGGRYLILDEPLTFLDIRYQFDFLHTIRGLLADGDLVVVGVVHDLNLASRFADHVVLLSRGRVLAAGDKHEVFTAELVHRAFAIEPVVHHDVERDRLYLLFD